MPKHVLATLASVTLAASALGLVTGLARAGSPGEPSAPLRAIVDAERAFARLSVEKGTKEAFLANLAEEAIVFRPGPVAALGWFRDRPASTGTLSWEPDFAAVSAAGDLGYTSGPWEYREKPGLPLATGHYVTIWRRRLDGSLAVVLDIGVRHAPETGPVRLAYGTTPQPGRGAAHPDAKTKEAGWLVADREFARDATAKGWAAAFVAHAADDVRLYRTGAPPVVGKQAVRALADRAGAHSSAPLAASGSDAGDLGYTYGTAEFRPAGTRPDSVEANAYVHIWRRSGDGRREIVLDVASPMPPPATQKP